MRSAEALLFDFKRFLESKQRVFVVSFRLLFLASFWKRHLSPNVFRTTIYYYRNLLGIFLWGWSLSLSLICPNPRTTPQSTSPSHRPLVHSIYFVCVTSLCTNRRQWNLTLWQTLCVLLCCSVCCAALCCYISLCCAALCCLKKGRQSAERDRPTPAKVERTYTCN